MKEHKKKYQMYQFTVHDWLEYILILLIKGTLICYLFYDSYKACILFIPFALTDYQKLKRQKHRKQKRGLTIQFKSLIEAVAGSLQAGYSLERAFMEAGRDLELLYEKETFIMKELQIIFAGLQMNLPIGELLKDFGIRSGNEDICNFANVVMAAKKSGGNLVRIIQKTVNCITEKIGVEEEIETLIAAKKLEERVMMIMPYSIIFYMRLTNHDFMEVLYHNGIGMICMTVCLFMIYVSGRWTERIMEIEV